MKQFISRFGGIIIGSLYGLLFRLSMGKDLGDHKFTDLFSITFIWIMPIIIGIVPMLFATKAGF